MKDVASAWASRPLGELLSIQSGFAFKSAQFSATQGTPLIRIRDLKNGTRTEVNFDGGFDPQYQVQTGDFLIGMDGEFRCHQWQGETALLNQRVCKLKDFTPDLNPRFLFYGINKYLTEIEERTSFTTVKHLSAKTIKAIDFPLPPLEEQRQIVAVLDEAFAGLARACAHAEANLQNARELFPSLLDEIFARDDWPELELQDLAHENCSLSYGIVQPGDDVEDGLPIVRPVDLDSDEIGLAGLKRINPDRASSYSRTQLDGSELLLCVRGTTGTISLASDELSGANVTRGIVPIRFNDQMHRLFGFYQFRSRQLQHQIAEKTYGAALMQINIRDVKKLRLRCPPMSEQIAAVERMDGIGKAHHELLSAAKKKLDDLEDLRQSLLQKAFSGELT